MNNKAFSLIELSVVLIIIGLLVMGITGGSSLIESSKIRNLASEIDNWKKALLIFRANNDRWPGDLDGDGFNVGWCGGDACRANEEYTINSFPAPYNNNVQLGEAGPFIELYLKKISNFRPDPENFIKPSLKVLPDFKWGFHRFEGKYINKNYFLSDTKLNTIWGVSTFSHNKKKSNNKILLGLDKKIDDGEEQKGNIRLQLSGDTWEIEGTRIGFMLTDL